MSEKPSEDTGLCTFTFSDGRRCRSLSSTPASLYCLPHLRKIVHLQQTDEAAKLLILPISGNFVPASALTQSLVTLFGSVAQGRMSSKQAGAMAKIANVLLKCISASHDEFREVYVRDYWAQLVRSSYGKLPKFTDSDDDEDSPDDSDSNTDDDSTGDSKPDGSSKQN